MRQKALFAALVFLGFAQASLGTTITTGSFDISGTFYVTLSEATPVITPGGSCPANVSCIFWQDGSGMHNGEVDISTSGLPNGDIPLAIAGNDAANISNLMNPPEVVGSAFSPTAFMTFNNDAVTTELLLNYIFPGIYSSSNCGAAPAVGQDCTPFGSLFNFVNNPPPTGSCKHHHKTKRPGEKSPGRRDFLSRVILQTYLATNEPSHAQEPTTKQRQRAGFRSSCRGA